MLRTGAEETISSGRELVDRKEAWTGTNKKTKKYKQ